MTNTGLCFFLFRHEYLPTETNSATDRKKSLPVERTAVAAETVANQLWYSANRIRKKRFSGEAGIQSSIFRLIVQVHGTTV